MHKKYCDWFKFKRRASPLIEISFKTTPPNENVVELFSALVQWEPSPTWADTVAARPTNGKGIKASFLHLQEIPHRLAETPPLPASLTALGGYPSEEIPTVPFCELVMRLSCLPTAVGDSRFLRFDTLSGHHEEWRSSPKMLIDVKRVRKTARKNSYKKWSLNSISITI